MTASPLITTSPALPVRAADGDVRQVLGDVQRAGQVVRAGVDQDGLARLQVGHRVLKLG